VFPGAPSGTVEIVNRRTISADRAILSLEATRALEDVAAGVGRSLERHAAAFDLSDAKLEVLEVLSDCDDERCCLHDIGARLGVTRPNITKLVDGLQRCGLVERLPHPEDGRMVQAHLTGAGAAMAERALPGRETRMADFWDALDDEELERLIAILGKVAAADDERRGGCGPRAQRRSAST
jgi:DNA-binding MarR family transcriptional regulator